MLPSSGCRHWQPDHSTNLVRGSCSYTTGWDMIHGKDHSGQTVASPEIVEALIAEIWAVPDTPQAAE